MLGCGPSRERASEQPSKPGRRCASFYVIIVLIITIATCKYYFLLCVPCHQPFLASLSVFSFFFFFPCNPLNRGLVIAFLSRETELFEERILPRNCALSRGLSRKEFSPISPVKLVPCSSTLRVHFRADLNEGASVSSAPETDLSSHFFLLVFFFRQTLLLSLSKSFSKNGDVGRGVGIRRARRISLWSFEVRSRWWCNLTWLM